MEDNLKRMLWNVFRSVVVAPLMLDDDRNGYHICIGLEMKILFSTGNSEINVQEKKL